MKKICGIYKITSPKGKIYIGQSTNIYKRWSSYKAEDCKRQVKLYRSIKKYGIDNHLFEVLEECDHLLLNEREIFHGINLNSIGENGLNLRLGNSNGKCSDEAKENISLAVKKSWVKGKENNRHFQTEEHRNKNSIGCKLAWIKRKQEGHTVSKEAIEACRKSNIGKKHSKEHKTKISKSMRLNYSTGRKSPMFGKKFSEEHKRKISIGNKGKPKPKGFGENLKLIWKKRNEKNVK